MDAILDNLRVLGPIAAFAWALLIVFYLWKPQRYFNSVLLMIACFISMFLISGLFGDYMGTALVVFFVLTMLALFLVPVLLIIDGLYTLKKESRTLAHMLPLILGVGIGIGEIASVVYVLGFGYVGEGTGLHLWAYFLFASVFYFSCLVLNFVVYTVFIQCMPHISNYDYVIIHGCGLRNGEEVTKLLGNRIDKAIEVYNKCKVKPYLIASGGQGSDEKISEAQAISDYLIARGIPKDKIILEDKSTTTMENLENSNEIILSRQEGRKSALVSSNYHIYRCLTYAKELKMKCVGIGAKVALYYWPTALIREFIAVFNKPRFFIWARTGYFLFMSPFLIIVTHL